MNDVSTNVSALRELVRDFVAERRWERYHTPKNLSMALSVEVAELQEHFQWWDEREIATRLEDAEERRRVGEEIADIGAYLFSLVNALGMDLSELMADKMRKNALKYPAEGNQGEYRRP